MDSKKNGKKHKLPHAPVVSFSHLITTHLSNNHIFFLCLNIQWNTKYEDFFFAALLFLKWIHVDIVENFIWRTWENCELPVHTHKTWWDSDLICTWEKLSLKPFFQMCYCSVCLIFEDYIFNTNNYVFLKHNKVLLLPCMPKPTDARAFCQNITRKLSEGRPPRLTFPSQPNGLSSKYFNKLSNMAWRHLPSEVYC